MKETVLDEISARRFLLGQLVPEEKAKIEEEAFLNPGSFAFLQAAEDDLIDEFLQNDLSADEKERFESHFLSKPGRHADLRIAQALHKCVNRSLPSPVSAERGDNAFEKSSLLSWSGIRGNPFRFALTASAIIIAVAGIWFAIRTLQQQQGQPPIRAQQQAVASPEPAATVLSGEILYSPTPNAEPTKPPKPPRQSAPVFSVVLIPGAQVRGEDNVSRVQLPATSGVARLQLPLIENSSYKKYQATLQTVEGRVIRRWSNLSVRTLDSGEGIQISVPTRLLDRQRRYRVLLGGISSSGNVNEISSYYFYVDD